MKHDSLSAERPRTGARPRNRGAVTRPTLPGASPRQSGELFRLLVEGVEDYAIFMLDPQGRVASWNAGAQKIAGYAAAEILTEHFSRLYPPEAVAKGRPEHALRTAEATRRFEDEGWRVRKDGSRFWASVMITRVNDRSGEHRGFANVMRDLTEHRRHEESLRQSEERFRLLAEGVQDYAIFMLDVEGHVSSWNLGAERIKGFRPAEIMGRHFSTFYPPEDLLSGKPDQMLRAARELGRVEDEGWRIRKDGSRFWANVVMTAIYDRSRTLVGFAKVTRDMTERRRAESLEQASLRTKEFLAVLAHELRHPLAPIRNAAGVMRLRSDGDPMIEWSQEVIDRQVGHLARLVDDLLDLSRITSGKIMLRREPIALADIVDRAVESSRPMILARKHRLEVRVPDEPLHVDADPVRLTQVMINLLNNSAKFTPAGGLIEITVAREGNEGLVRVRDTGIGISADLIPRMFDLFTQGNRTGDGAEGGLGVGLTLVRRLVEMHGGSVQASSEGPGHGSEFSVRLKLFVTGPSRGR